MKIERKETTVTLGYGEEEITVVMDCDATGRPISVEAHFADMTRFETSAEDFERIAAAVEQARHDATSYPYEHVCPDHGYYTGSECPKCQVEKASQEVRS